MHFHSTTDQKLHIETVQNAEEEVADRGKNDLAT
jgi:hypothetical protein